ncbi:MAG TPA: hypothetical protein P5556_07285 [Candidatus Gastranaerophilales bacterium]|nr:hypothetical protein [Candidatus Gastranaerophilales bacterium]
MKIFGLDLSNEGCYNYVMKELYGVQQVITGQNGPIKTSGASAFGANALFNSMQNYDEGASIQYMRKDQTGKFDVNGALGFAGTKISLIDSSKNSDGKVSTAEYISTIPDGMNKEAMINALDINKDGFISAGEEAAITLLTDCLDGSYNGVITKQGRTNAFYLLNNRSEQFAQGVKSIYEKNIQQSEQGYKNPWNEINGAQGPYDSATLIGKGANVGAKMLDLVKTKELQQLTYSNYQYMFKNPDNSFNIDSGLAAHSSIMLIHDKNSDGKVSSWEIDKKVFDVTDMNGDNELDAGEFLAMSMVIDTNDDGIITFEEKQAFQLKTNDINKKEELFNEIKNAYVSNSIEEKEANFEMPEKTNYSFPPNYGNPFGNQKYTDFYGFLMNFLSAFSQKNYF